MLKRNGAAENGPHDPCYTGVRARTGSSARWATTPPVRPIGPNSEYMRLIKEIYGTNLCVCRVRGRTEDSLMPHGTWTLISVVKFIFFSLRVLKDCSISFLHSSLFYHNWSEYLFRYLRYSVANARARPPDTHARRLGNLPNIACLTTTGILTRDA